MRRIKQNINTKKSDAMKEKVTVIVPVYNVEKYLNECINSIINQSYKNIEIILVDDGSTDQSGLLCDYYSLLDKRIKVIHKENGGLSDARNAALEIRSGDYVTFVDSDDYVSPYFIEILLKAVIANCSEIAALTGGVDFWDKETFRPRLAENSNEFTSETMSAKDALALMLYQKIATGAPFKICRTEIFDNIRFPIGYYYEDVATTYKEFEKVSKITVIQSPVYAYRKRMDSLIRQKFSTRKLDALKIYSELVRDSTINLWGLRDAAISRCFSMMYSVFLQVPEDKRETKKLIWDKLKECRRSVVCNRSKLIRKKNKYAAWISYLGMDISYSVGRKFGQKGSMN